MLSASFKGLLCQLIGSECGCCGWNRPEQGRGEPTNENLVALLVHHLPHFGHNVARPQLMRRELDTRLDDVWWSGQGKHQ